MTMTPGLSPSIACSNSPNLSHTMQLYPDPGRVPCLQMFFAISIWKIIRKCNIDATAASHGELQMQHNFH
jgi:hypothetical protein